RQGDKSGDIVITERNEVIELPPIKTVLRFGKSAGSVRIPVSLGIRLNEFGTLDVWCESKKTPHRWKLAFQLRMDEEVTPYKGSHAHTLEETAVNEALAVMEEAFHTAARTLSGVTPENVSAHMETVLGLHRNGWPLSAIRKMWDSLIIMKERRQASPRHEARWLNLCGFLLRPGFGYQLDDWRIKELWKVFSEGPVFSNDIQCRAEWWILWRRVAGGLDDMQQEILLKKVVPVLLPSKRKSIASRLPGAEVMEMWMLAARLERLTQSVKTDLGNEVMRMVKRAKGKAQSQYYWALSRLGARVPFHGPIDKVVPKEAVETWIHDVLKTNWLQSKDARHAITQMARKTNDRIRDIDEPVRHEVIEAFTAVQGAGHHLRQIREPVPLEGEDEAKIFGESLPAGLYVRT
ncbi:MAG: molecular chaperone DnaK, partial [Deltaproteobacteria bacterium]